MLLAAVPMAPKLEEIKTMILEAVPAVPTLQQITGILPLHASELYEIKKMILERLTASDLSLRLQHKCRKTRFWIHHSFCRNSGRENTLTASSFALSVLTGAFSFWESRKST
jgi:hypothetical protein